MEKNGRLVPADRRHLRRERANIGMCFQYFNLFPHMSVLGNCIEGPIHLLGLTRTEAIERAEELFGNPQSERTRQFLAAVNEAI